MYCVGLTGSIASGKSTVAAHFAALGAQIISADAIAKALVQPGKPALNTIVQHFGEALLTPEGHLNRRALRRRITTCENERIWLEGYLHPQIRQTIQEEINTSQAPYCIIEIPLLVDRSDYPYLNRILLVKSNEEAQITRLMKRDNTSREDALALWALTKHHVNKREAMADDVITNTGSIDAIHQQVRALHLNYTAYNAHDAKY